MKPAKSPQKVEGDSADSLSPVNMNGVSIISADSLDAIFNRSPDTANSKYKGQQIYVSGQIKHINSVSLLGNRIVSLKVGDGVFSHVLCVSARPNFVTGLEKGQQITVRGRCIGTVLSHVQLKDCEIVK
jgi:hypothetical protein